MLLYCELARLEKFWPVLEEFSAEIVAFHWLGLLA
jgi:hypothetical protein